jgi:hypothetical protein
MTEGGIAARQKGVRISTQIQLVVHTGRKFFQKNKKNYFSEKISLDGLLAITIICFVC